MRRARDGNWEGTVRVGYKSREKTKAGEGMERPVSFYVFRFFISNSKRILFYTKMRLISSENTASHPEKTMLSKVKQPRLDMMTAS